MIGLIEELLVDTPPLIPLTDLNSLYVYLMLNRPTRESAEALGQPVVVSHQLRFECAGAVHIGDAIAFSYANLDVLVMACSPRLAPEGKWGMAMVCGTESRWSICTKMVRLSGELHRMRDFAAGEAARQDLGLCLMLVGAAVTEGWFPPDTIPVEL